MFSNEASFPTNGCVNGYNDRKWGSQPPIKSLGRKKVQQRLAFCVVCLRDERYDHFVSQEKNINGAIYINMLDDFFPQIFEISNVSGVYFKQVELLLIARIVFETPWTKSNRYIGRDRLPRSPDPSDFFSTGKFYWHFSLEKIQILAHLKGRIRIAVSREMLSYVVWDNVNGASNRGHIYTHKLRHYEPLYRIRQTIADRWDSSVGAEVRCFARGHMCRWRHQITRDHPRPTYSWARN